MEFIQETRRIRLSTGLGEGKLGLRALHLDESLSTPFRLEIDALSDDADVDLDKLLGHNLTVAIDPDDMGETRHLNGTVIEATLTGERDRRHGVRLVAAPNLWFLTQTRSCRIFTDFGSVIDIVESVLSDNGLSDYEFRTLGSYDAYEYCVQYDESDFAFVSRLLEREGIYYYFEHENGSHKIVFVDSMQSHDPQPGFEVLRYEPSGQTGGLQEQAIQRWRPSKRVRPGRAALADFNFLTPGADLRVESSIERGHAMATGLHYEYPGHYGASALGQNRVDTRIEELQADHHVVQAEATVRGVATGRTFTLTDHPVGAANVDWLVTGARLMAEATGFESGAGGEESVRVVFEAMPATEVFRPARRTPWPRIQGPQTAMVVGEPGDEIFVDEHLRVKLSFPWLPGTPSRWTRVSQAWTGDGFGAVSIPRVGDEVVVAFEGGDPDRPLVVGRVYNGASRPPYALPDLKTVTTFKSNSSTGGGGFNELRFEDKKGEENVFLHAQKDHDLRVQEVMRTMVGVDRHAIVVGDDFAEIQADHHATVGGDSTRSVAGTDNTQIGGDSYLGVGGERHANVGSNDHHTAGATMNLNAGANLLGKAGANIVLVSGASAHIKAGATAVIEASAGVTLKCGGSFVSVTPAGVHISGPIVGVNSGGAALSGPGTGAAKAGKPPTATKPAEALKSEPGQKPPKPLETENPPTPFEIDSNPVAAALARARAAAAPFCERCAGGAT